MDIFTSAIASGVIYDMMKNGIAFTAKNIKDKFVGWMIDESSATLIADELKKLNLNDDMSEKAIEKIVNSSLDIQSLFKEIKTDKNADTITQIHSGTGDNVGRDKITNEK